MASNPPASTLKVILVGSSGVGKTSLVNAYFDNPVEVNALPTVAPASCSTTIDIGNGTKVELQIWDTAGQERFQAISQMFYRDSHVAFVCYDSTTADSVENWINRVLSEVPECIIFIVATKSDLLTPEQLAACQQKGEEMKTKFRAHAHMVTSSSKGQGVRELFMEAAKCSSIIFQVNQPSVDIEAKKTNGQKGCCG